MIDERRLIEGIRIANTLQFLVLDELHTYRGRQGADVALLVRRVREMLGRRSMQCIGTSATMASDGSYEQRQRKLADTASKLFGVVVRPENVIGETLQRVTKRNAQDPEFTQELYQRLKTAPELVPTTFQMLINDPLAAWIENTFGVEEETAEEGYARLKRIEPISLLRAAQSLCDQTRISFETCANSIQRLLITSYNLGWWSTSSDN